MKKLGKIMLVAAMALVSANASALAPQWSKGTMVANLNVGFDNVDFGSTVSLDYVLVDEWWQGHFTVGGEVGFGTWSTDYWDENRYVFTPRATYGLNITDQFEVHATVGLGFGLEKGNDRVTNSKTSDTFGYSTEMLGCRYFFLNNLAVMAECGYAYRMPEFRVGISLKL